MTPDRCFWNGTSTDFFGYNPCPEVLEAWGDHIVVMECQETPLWPQQPGFTSDTAVYYPTSRWLAVNRDSPLFDHLPNKEAVMSEGRMLVDTEVFDLMLGVGEGKDEGTTGGELPECTGGEGSGGRA